MKRPDDLIIDDFIEGTRGGPTIIVGGKRKCYRRRNKRPGRCGNPAGWGTDHKGEGACKYHGGATPRGPASPHFKHGRYSRYMKDSLAGIMEQLRKEVDLESIDEEILAATALFAWHMRLSGEDWLKHAKDLLIAIVSFKEKRHRMLYGEKFAISVTEVQTFVVKVVNVIDREIADAELKARLYRGIGVPDDLLDRAGIGAPGTA